MRAGEISGFVELSRSIFVLDSFHCNILTIKKYSMTFFFHLKTILQSTSFGQILGSSFTLKRIIWKQRIFRSISCIYTILRLILEYSRRNYGINRSLRLWEMGRYVSAKIGYFSVFCPHCLENEILLELIIYRWNEDNIPMGICHMVTWDSDFVLR